MIDYFEAISHVMVSLRFSFSSPEATILLVSTKNRDLWAGPTMSKRKEDYAHAQKIGSGQSSGQRSRFLVLIKRIAASGDEDGYFLFSTWQFNSVGKRILLSSFG